MNSGSTDLIVALDYPRAEPAEALIRELEGQPVIYKVGSELFMAEGPAWVRELVHRKCRIFLDLKFHDIPNTVAKAAKQAALLHVEMFTLHLAGGSQMVRAVAQELSDIPSLRPKVLGVSVLTSFDDVRWAEVTRALTGHAVAPVESVEGLVAHATAWGVDGIVCSAHELPAVTATAPGLYKVVPGIRLAGGDAQDQARVMTPAQARQAGANAIVVGRPITQARDPRAAVKSILDELAQTA